VSVPARIVGVGIVAGVAVLDIAYRIIFREPLRESLGINRTNRGGTR
jgi:hypothetical protein